MRCVVVGIGEFGEKLIKELDLSSWDIVAVDRDLERLESVKRIAGLCIAGDGTQKDLYTDHELVGADILVAGVIKSFETQVLLVDMARKIGIRKIIAIAPNESQQEILERLGAHEVIVPQQQVARQISLRMAMPDVDKYFEVEEGIALVELPVPQIFVGKTLTDIKLRKKYNLNLVGVARKRDDSAKYRIFDSVPDPSLVFQGTDRIYVCGGEWDVSRLINLDKNLED